MNCFDPPQTINDLLRLTEPSPMRLTAPDRNPYRSLSTSPAGIHDLASMLAPTAPDQYSVWLKGRQVLGTDPTLWRLDDYGNWILFTEYGNRNSEYGWEIDHIRPVAIGGPDELWNTRPLQWKENARRQLARFLYRRSHCGRNMVIV